MTQLSDLFLEIKESSLTKSALEKYEQELAYLYATMRSEIGDLKKKKAIFFLIQEKDEEGKKRPDVKVRRIWEGTQDGQKLLGLEDDARAVKRMGDSVRSRIFQTY